MPRVDDARLQTALIEDFIQRNPVDASGFHGHRGDTAAFQPIRHLLQIFGEGAKAADWLAIRIVVHGDENLPSADVDPGRARLFYRPVAETQAFASLLGHTDLSFLIRGSQAAQK